MSNLSQFLGGSVELPKAKLYATTAAPMFEDNRGTFERSIKPYNGCGVYVGEIPIPKSGLTIGYTYYLGFWSDYGTSGIAPTTLKIGDTAQFMIPGYGEACTFFNYSKVGPSFGRGSRTRNDEVVLPDINSGVIKFEAPAPYGTIYGAGGNSKLDSRSSSSVDNIKASSVQYWIPELNTWWSMHSTAQRNNMDILGVPQLAYYQYSVGSINKETCRGSVGIEYSNGSRAEFKGVDGGLCLSYPNFIGGANWTTGVTQSTYLDSRVYLTNPNTYNSIIQQAQAITGTVTIPGY